MVALLVASQLGVDLGGGTQTIDLGQALHVVELGGRSTALVGDADERWRLLSSHFVHTSWMHLAFNLAFLFPVGGALEHAVRARDYAVLLVVTMIGSAFTSLLLTPQVSAGASGIVFGLLAAAVVFGLRHGRQLGPHVRHHYGWWVLPFLLVTLAITLGNPSVDHASHLGGLVAGIAYAPFLRLRGTPATPREGWAGAVAVAVATMLLWIAPVVARGGAPVRVGVGGGWTAALPASWGSHYGLLGELEWSAASGLVSLTAGDAPRGDRRHLVAWYVGHRLDPLAASGHALDVVETPGHDEPELPQGAIHVRFTLRREQTPMVRDVYFLPAAGGAARAVFLSLEVPRWWAERYQHARAALLGSLRGPRNVGTGVTRVSVAAIE